MHVLVVAARSSSGEEALADLVLLEALFDSADSGRWKSVTP